VGTGSEQVNISGLSLQSYGAFTILFIMGETGDRGDKTLFMHRAEQGQSLLGNCHREQSEGRGMIIVHIPARYF